MANLLDVDIPVTTEKLSDGSISVLGHPKFQTFLLCFVLPATLCFFVYYGFVTNYTVNVFTLHDFHQQYDHNIFRYRVLGKLALLGVYNLFTSTPHFFFVEKVSMNAFLRMPSTDFYHCYFITNTLFLCLTAWMFSLIFGLKQFTLSARETQLWLMLIIFLMVISQFVVTPYDTLSYFFLALSFYLMLREQTALTVAALVATIVLATLTRESAALSLSFYATLYLMRKALPNQTTILGFSLILATFLATYLGLRVALGWHNGTSNGMQPYEMFRSTSSLVFMFAITLLIVDFQNAARRKAVLVYFLVSLPYLISILLTGILFEIRLWIPVLMGIIVLTMLRYRDTPDLKISWKQEQQEPRAAIN